MKKVLVTLLIIFFSCDRKEEMKSIDGGFFTINFEDELDIKKIDNGFILNHVDTLTYNRGISINSLTEIDPKVVYVPPNSNVSQDNEMLNKLDSLKNTYVVRTRRYDLDEFRKQNVTYYDIDKRIWKFTYPRKDKGITGIYSDSIYYGCQGDVCGNMKFNLYGKNLSQKSTEALRKALKTIKIKKE